jgi:hypothetical protein
LLSKFDETLAFRAMTSATPFGVQALVASSIRATRSTTRVTMATSM